MGRGLYAYVGVSILYIDICMYVDVNVYIYVYVQSISRHTCVHKQEMCRRLQQPLILVRLPRYHHNAFVRMASFAATVQVRHGTFAKLPAKVFRKVEVPRCARETDAVWDHDAAGALMFGAVVGVVGSSLYFGKGSCVQ